MTCLGDDGASLDAAPQCKRSCEADAGHPVGPAPVAHFWIECSEGPQVR